MDKIGEYVVYHLHTDLSNCTTVADSVTKYTQYIERAKELGMKAIAFTEHGNIYRHHAKRVAAREAGLLFIHGVEAYITMNEQDKVRDNYHAVLLAKNYEGFKEINRLTSGAYNRDDAHFYYTPRIFMSDLENTSDNIIITSACLGGALNSQDKQDEERFLRFMIANRKRCFLEIQHHHDPNQVEYNKKLWELSKRYGIKLIAGTDTHALNEEHLLGRQKLQDAKNTHFDNESEFALQFLSYSELCEYYEKQWSLPKEVWMQAIDNTNLLLEMCEDYSLDDSIKYPNVFKNPDEQLRELVYRKLDEHPYALKRHDRNKICEVIETELDAFKKTGQAGYLLIMNHLCEWERKHGERIGYGRGSITGSMCAYLMGITSVDSMRFGLNFFRYCSPERISLADIDVDHSEEDREKTKSFLLDDHMGFENIQSAEIITFNTIATKGAIADMCRALQIPLDEARSISKEAGDGDEIPERLRKKYPELFKLVDIVKGTVVSYGSHACGVLVTDHNITEELGTCTSAASKYLITAENMGEIDHLNFTKFDVLGLDSIDLINRISDLAGIERPTPDTIDLEDAEVWKSIREDTTCIFQFTSAQASAYLRRLMSDASIAKFKARDPYFSMFKLFTLASALLRPSCASFRDDVANGDAFDNGCSAINEFLREEQGHVIYQETIMRFLTKFAGYTPAESDVVRRAIAKKKGTEKLLPEIEARFIQYAPQHYNITQEEARQIIGPFIVTIEQASEYSFSLNHSCPYAAIGYIIGYLRHYYPLEFVAAALNVYENKLEKIGGIIEYAGRHGIKISPPRWGQAKSTYALDRENNTVYKGLASVKTINDTLPEELYDYAQFHKYDHFSDILIDIKENTSIRKDQIDALIDIDFFAEYGNIPTLRNIRDAVEFFKWGESKSVKKDKAGFYTQFIEPHATGTTKAGKPAASWSELDVAAIMRDFEDYQMGLAIPDLTYAEKAQIQRERLGYVDLTTGKMEDRLSVIVISKVIPLISKRTGKPWIYKADLKSIGTGKVVRCGFSPNLFRSWPFKEGDTLRIHPHGMTEDNGYWTVISYEYLI